MKPWIGFDLDGTIARYESGMSLDTIGPPIPSMIEELKGFILGGLEVRIVTARVAACGEANERGTIDDEAFAEAQRELIQQWCETHIGQKLLVTATKDFGMIALYDDRAIQIETNQGRKATDIALETGVQIGRAKL